MKWHVLGPEGSRLTSIYLSITLDVSKIHLFEFPQKMNYYPLMKENQILCNSYTCVCQILIKGDLRTICRFSYMKVYKLITLGTKFKTLLSLGRKITMFSKFITNYIEQGWWHSSLTLKCMHLLLKEVNKRGRHAYNLHGWTCLPSGIVMEIHCHITGIFEAAVRLRLPSCCSV